MNQSTQATQSADAETDTIMVAPAGGVPAGGVPAAEPHDDTRPTQTETHAELLRRAAARMPVMLRVMKLVAKRVIAEHAPRMASLGEGQVRALHVLYDEGTLQVGELAERCGVADPTVSKMLKSLEHNGLVARRTDPENRRAVWVSLTATGRSHFDEMQAHFEQGMAQVLAGLSGNQLRDLLRTMNHVERLLAAPEAGRATDDADDTDDADRASHRHDSARTRTGYETAGA